MRLGTLLQHPVAVVAGLGGLAAAMISPVRATTLDFEDQAGGNSITNQYQSAGVLFSAPGNLPATIYLDPPEATSGVNILVGTDNFSDLFLNFVDPATGLPSPDFLACPASLNVVSVGIAVITVQSRDSGGSILQSFVLTHPDGPPNGYQNVDPLLFDVGQVASIEMLFTVPAPEIDGVGIDDLAFSFECAPSPVLPTTWGRVKQIYR